MQLHMQGDGMRRKRLPNLAIILLLFLSCFLNILYIDESSADDLYDFYVNDDFTSSTPGWGVTHFDKIQDAIDNATAGYRIIVYNGNYVETITIDKRISLFGEDAEETTINGNNNGDVVTINTSNVDLSGFTIKNSGSGETDAGIKVKGNNSRIIDNIINYCINGIFINNYNDTIIAFNNINVNTYGVFLSSSYKNQIEYNNIHSNSKDGIFLNENCKDSNIIGNNIYGNYNGIYLSNKCDDNIINGNTIYSNAIIGVRIENSSNNQIDENTIELHGAFYGIMIVGNNNDITNNVIQNNNHGIFLLADNYTTIQNNILKENTRDGIRLQNSTGNKITKNRITYNKRYGVYINYFSINNEIYDNYFKDNEYNAWDISTSNNFWSKTGDGGNIIGGSKIGGNFWDDYTGEDTNKDGIGNTPYNILPGSKKDDNPLVPRTPTAKAGGIYTAYLGETITFDGSRSSDPDGNTLTFNWDFGDENTGEGQKPKHIYTSEGEYDVVLTVTNNYDKTDTDTAKAIILIDTQPPTILIEKYGTYDNHLNSFTFLAKVTDNTKVSEVYIEYWYEDSGKMIVDMDNTGGSYYQKVITTPAPTDRVYCIIYANDTSGNQANTKNPFANASGPYEGYVTQTITFDASNSFDLDGEIIEYSWDFGDGTTGTGEKVEHSYLTNGRYTVKLTVTDNDGNIATDTAYATIDEGIKFEPSDSVITQIETLYNITIEEKFFAYDTDKDGLVDTFFDPSDVLKDVKGSILTLNNSSVFLISIDDPYVPEFMWDINTTTNTDSIITIKEVKVDNVEPVEKGDTATAIVTIDEYDSWIWLHIEDRYPHATLTVKVNDTKISEDRIWRKNSRVYVLDNPGTEYHFIYEDIIIPETLKWIRFTPATYGTIDKDNPAITIEYNVPVTIEYADIVSLYISEDEIIPITVTITSELQTSDYKTYTYTPDRNLPSGEYEIHIEARDEAGNLWRNNSFYSFISYEYEEQGSNIFSIIPYLGFIIGIGIAVFLLSKKFNINLKSFVYIKNRKIIPFFKPVIFGPLSLDIDHKHIKKAEFYVNGQLKDTLTQEPYVWKWDEPAFMKQKIETKIYDQEGNSNSSGEMTFYMFNPKLFK
jgi:parallel beta-helix repeat protein